MLRKSGWLMSRPRLRAVLRLALMSAGLWLVLTEGQALGPEALVVVLAAIAVGRLYGPEHMHRWRPLQLLAFLAYFARGSLYGGLDVARRAFAPHMPIEPCTVRRPVRVGSGQPRTLLVSAISLMPGTLTADVDEEELVVHLLAPDMAAEIDGLERRIEALFGPRQEMTRNVGQELAGREP